jgi:hypothetical protein
MRTTALDDRLIHTQASERAAAAASLDRVQMRLADLEARIVQPERPGAAGPPFVTVGNALESTLRTLGDAVAAAHAPAE